MLNRWLPPQDEGASMLRLLNLLTWKNPELPSILCGPLYDACNRFDILNQDHSLNITMPIIYTFPMGNVEVVSPLIRVVEWRVNVLSHLSNQAGVLSQYFPMDDRRSVASKIYAMLDSMIPLIDKLEKDPVIDIEYVYKHNLQPEKQRGFVVDYSYTYFLSYIIPYVISATTTVPSIILEILNCGPEDPEFKKLVEILRCLTIKKERTRHLLNIVFSALRGKGVNDWLSDILIIVIKYALLGNYPSTEQYADFSVRRNIYNLTREKILVFFSSCGDENDATLGIVQALLSVMLLGIFSVKSFDYVPTDHLLTNTDVYQYFRIIKRILKLVTNFYPNPTKENLISDVYRFLSPIRQKYQNIFFAIHANSLKKNKNNLDQYDFLTGSNIRIETLNHMYVYIILDVLNTSDIDLLNAMQIYFDKTKCLWIPPDIPEHLYEKICSLSCVIVAMSAFQVINGSQALYFEQAARLLKIVGAIAPEKTSLLYCNNCNTVRFRPVGIHLPSSHITLLADLANNRVHCVDCSSSNLSQVNLLGKYVRCYLTNKKNRAIVNLALCSACMHISICGFYSQRHGIICKECEFTVRNMQQISKECLSCRCLMTKTSPDDPLWHMIDIFDDIKIKYWCKRCTPFSFKQLRSQNSKIPLFSESTLLEKALKLPARRFY